MSTAFKIKNINDKDKNYFQSTQREYSVTVPFCEAVSTWWTPKLPGYIHNV